MSRLESLPPELLLRIIDCIPRPTDLKALCLTSKVIRTPATAKLYHHVILDRKVPGWPSLPETSGLISPSNPGVAQIRKLQVIMNNLEESTEEVKGLWKVLRILPDNILHELEFELPFDEKLALQVLRQQESLIQLAVGPMQFQFEPCLRLDSLGQRLCQKIRALQLPWRIEGLHDLEAYQRIIARSPLKKLCVRTFSSVSRLNRSLDDSADTDGLIFHSLFSHMREESAKILSLEELLLEDTELAFSERTISRYIDWSVLQVLGLFQCPGADKLVQILTARFKTDGAKLREFEFETETDTTVPAMVLDEFLESFQGLETISISGTEYSSRPNLSWLINHKDSLKKFLFKPAQAGKDSNGPDLSHLALDASFYSTISSQCRQLKEVALVFPSIEPRRPEPSALQKYDTALSWILDLPSLSTLRIFNLPGPQLELAHAVGQADYVNLVANTAYTHEVDSFVVAHLSKLFEQKQKAPSPVLCFNAPEGANFVNSEYADLRSEEVLCYVPLRQQDVFGRSRIVLQKTSLSEVHYHEIDLELACWPWKYCFYK